MIKKQNKTIPFTLLALLLCALTLLPACGQEPAEEEAEMMIKIAVIAPFGEEYLELGDSSRNGAVLAVEEWNRRGGLLGRTIQVVLKDSDCDYLTGREAAQAALNEGAQFIIGPVCAGATRGVAQVVSDADALQITHACVYPGITLDNEDKVYPHVFRLPVTDQVQAMAMAQFARERLQAKTAAILTLETDEYATLMGDDFAAAFEKDDGDIVERESCKEDMSNLYEVLEKIRDENPDVLYVPGYHATVNTLVQQARSFGLLQTVLGSDGWDAPDLNLSAVNRSYFPSHYFAGEPRVAVQVWIENHEARYMVPPDALSTLAYDATNMLLAGIQEARRLDPDAVARALESLTFETVSGRVTFDDRHDAVREVIILKVQDNRITFEERRVPEREE